MLNHILTLITTCMIINKMFLHVTYSFDFLVTFWTLINFACSKMNYVWLSLVDTLNWCQKMSDMNLKEIMSICSFGPEVTSKISENKKMINFCHMFMLSQYRVIELSHVTCYRWLQKPCKVIFMSNPTFAEVEVVVELGKWQPGGRFRILNQGGEGANSPQKKIGYSGHIFAF